MAKRKADNSPPYANKKILITDENIEIITSRILNCEKNGIDIKFTNLHFTGNTLEKICEVISNAKNVISFELDNCLLEPSANYTESLHSQLFEAIKNKKNIKRITIDMSEASVSDLKKLTSSKKFDFASIQEMTIKNVESGTDILSNLVAKAIRMENIKEFSFEKFHFENLNQAKKLEYIINLKSLEHLKINNCAFSNYNSIYEILNFIMRNTQLKSVEFKNIHLLSYHLGHYKNLKSSIDSMVESLNERNSNFITFSYYDGQEKTTTPPPPKRVKTSEIKEADLIIREPLHDNPFASFNEINLNNSKQSFFPSVTNIPIAPHLISPAGMHRVTLNPIYFIPPDNFRSTILNTPKKPATASITNLINNTNSSPDTNIDWRTFNSSEVTENVEKSEAIEKS